MDKKSCRTDFRWRTTGARMVRPVRWTAKTPKTTALNNAIRTMPQRVRVAKVHTKDPRRKRTAITTATNSIQTMNVLFKKNEQLHTMDL
ncbi:hypothetical protein QTP88_016060 [Uroleucon formosanum]